MNAEKDGPRDNYKSLLLLDEIAKGEPLSQRDLSKKLNIALGLVNSYLKNLVAKGYVTVASVPAKKYAYFLTPKGFTEKTRLTYHHLQNFTSLYRQAKRDFTRLFVELERQAVKRVAFAGVDEVAEIAYLSLQEVEIELAGVFDDARKGTKFFKTVVMPFQEIHGTEYDRVIVSTFLKREEVYQRLMEYNVSGEKVLAIYDIPSVGR